MNRALLIGINECQGADTLLGPHQDVARFRDFLLSRGGFEEANCTVLCDPAADHAALPAAIERLIADAAADDGSLCVLYYSGHGYADTFGRALADEGYVSQPGTYSMILACDWSELPKHGVNSDQFKRMVAPLAQTSSRIVAIFDCCEIGGMRIDENVRIKGVKNARLSAAHYASVRRFAERVPNGVGLTACAMNETTADVSALPSSGFDGPGGAFSMFLLQELQQGRSDAPVSEVCQRVAARLAQARFIQSPSAYPPAAAAMPLPIGK